MGYGEKEDEILSHPSFAGALIIPCINHRSRTTMRSRVPTTSEMISRTNSTC